MLSRISKAFNHEIQFLNAKKTGMFHNKRVDMRHATWRTPQAVQVLCANFPKSLSWCFPSVLDCQTKLYTYSAIFSFSSLLGVLEHSSFGICRFKPDHFLSMHCVPCVLWPRLRVLRVNSILTWLTWKHFRPKDLLWLAHDLFPSAKIWDFGNVRSNNWHHRLYFTCLNVEILKKHVTT